MIGIKNCYEDKVISRSEFEGFETTYKSAQANYNAAQTKYKRLAGGCAGPHKLG
jgi:multidrug resistance efflux pump